MSIHERSTLVPLPSLSYETTARRSPACQCAAENATAPTLGRPSAAAPPLPRYDGAAPTTPASGSTRPSASVHCCSADVVVVNAAKRPSGVAVWHPMQWD